MLAIVGLAAESIRVEKQGQGIVTQTTPNTPTLITNWTEFTNTYGDFDQAIDGAYLHHSMFGYFLNSGTAAFVVGLPVQVSGSNGLPQLPSGEGAYLANAAGQRLLRISTTGPLKKEDQVTVEVQPQPRARPKLRSTWWSRGPEVIQRSFPM